jgi:hypothetical protein
MKIHNQVMARENQRRLVRIVARAGRLSSIGLDEMPRYRRIWPKNTWLQQRMETLRLRGFYDEGYERRD